MLFVDGPDTNREIGIFEMLMEITANYSYPPAGSIFKDRKLFALVYDNDGFNPFVDKPVITK